MPWTQLARAVDVGGWGFARVRPVAHILGICFSKTKKSKTKTPGKWVACWGLVEVGRSRAASRKQHRHQRHPNNKHAP